MVMQNEFNVDERKLIFFDSNTLQITLKTLFKPSFNDNLCLIMILKHFLWPYESYLSLLLLIIIFTF